jgi:hypothetical protein
LISASEKASSVAALREPVTRLEEWIAKVIIGQREFVRRIMIAFAWDGKPRDACASSARRGSTFARTKSRARRARRIKYRRRLCGAARTRVIFFALREKLDHVLSPTRKISLSPADTGFIERIALCAADDGISTIKIET